MSAEQTATSTTSRLRLAGQRMAPYVSRFGVPSALVLAALIMVASVGLHHNGMASPIDEWVYLDYLFKMPGDLIMVRGEPIGHRALEMMSCQGVTPYGAMGAPCGSDYEAQRSTYPYGGLTSADGYTPLYFVLTWLLGKGIRLVTGLNDLQAFRMTGFFWLAASLVVFYLLGRAMKVHKIAILAIGLVFIATPFAWWTYTYVSTDAPSFFFGVLLLWGAIRYLQGSGSPWWMVAVAGIAVLFKVSNILAVGVVALLFLIIAVTNLVQARRGRLEEGQARSPFRLLLIASLMVIVSLVLEYVWLMIRSAIAVGPPPYVDILNRPSLREMGLEMELLNFLPGTLISNVHVTGSGGAFAYTIPEHLILPASWLCIAGVVGWLMIKKTGVLENSLAWTVAVSSTLFAPILVLAMVLLEGIHIQLPPRYGASVLPGFLLAIGMIMTSKAARGLVLSYGVLLLAFVCVFAARYA
ncbi:hypothetical protein [Microterricola viridarii]|uniref:Glycosyltransferase RgtA/B/C/D-like domain-containing protein n=1 Tax=Microterricola viridarii TaxID=412690 RepID=A0A120I0W8_9MICO|nr:hypothetical protein [Microterricola viridarii]AMB57843.1 hypothetical protein AWU67_02040 [Microterricola viridarii]